MCVCEATAKHPTHTPKQQHNELPSVSAQQVMCSAGISFQGKSSFQSVGDGVGGVFFVLCVCERLLRSRVCASIPVSSWTQLMCVCDHDDDAVLFVVWHHTGG